MVVWILVFWRLGYATFWDPDEATYAQATREMLVSGDWLVPTFNGQPFFDKPILFYLCQLVTFRWLGPTEFAARLVPALSTLGLFASVWWLGIMFFDSQVASLAVLMLALLPGTFALSAVAIPDMTFTAFLFSGMAMVAVSALHNRPRLQYPGYLLIAFAVMTKGPLALVLAGLTFGLALLVAPRVRHRLLSLRWVVGFLGVVLTTSPWFLYMWWRFGDAFIEGYILRENIWLYSRPLFGPAASKMFYLRIVPVALLPWTPLLIGRLIDNLRGDRCSDEERLLWTWAVVVTGFFTFSYFKYDRYVYPIAPALCLVAAHAWHRLRRCESWHSQIGTAVGAVATGSVLVAFGIALVPLASRLQLEISRWLDLAAIALISSGVLLIGRLYVDRFRPPAMPVTVAASLLLVYGIALGAVVPGFERAKPTKHLAEWTASNTTSSVAAAYRMTRWNPSWRFYVNRPVEILEMPDQLDAFLERNEGSACLMLKSDLEVLTSAGYRLRILHERPGLFVTSGRAILRGGESNWQTFVVVGR
jgi:4-amino-4-deoxy-L-arabinose transferase-like glycosyltransferase